jgi:hypothetical protein
VKIQRRKITFSIHVRVLDCDKEIHNIALPVLLFYYALHVTPGCIWRLTLLKLHSGQERRQREAVRVN